MRTDPITPPDLADVIAVPPWCRKRVAKRTPDFEQTYQLLRHIAAGGIRNFMFGGNAEIFHCSLRHYTKLLEWMAGLSEDWWLLPACGPGFGRAQDQAPLLRRLRFPAVMMLPCSDPRTASGLETGLNEIVEAAETPLILYLKDETTLGTDLDAGLDMLGRLVESKACVGIKYAVVRKDPTVDSYLERLLQRVPRERVVSGIGERPAIAHLRTWQLPGFTTGSGCVAPALTRKLFEAGRRGDWMEAERVRQIFLPLEDLRDVWNPARVLHHAVELAGIAKTGPLLPYLSPLTEDQLSQLEPIALALKAST
ncbi:MAG TPA: dihydrodipicolinate synthase family protein [Verrucomicrobiota bacterium]|nr:dihydrodipicolinate synthase family protein [Verrucomicrobiales bacterium]HRI12990.1 dihydrodipicolinate synthase family protein [Verrucomicrobiota bacterium]